MNIFTIGYEGAKQIDVIETLKKWSITLLVDVRELPLSRKKGFSKTALCEGLKKYNIDYYHSKALGCPRDIRHEYREDKNWSRYTHRFLNYLDKQEDELMAVYNLAKTNSICLFCFEKDPLFCHRNYVADRLAGQSSKSANIFHLNSQTMGAAVPQLMGEPILQQLTSFSDIASCSPQLNVGLGD